MTPAARQSNFDHTALTRDDWSAVVQILDRVHERDLGKPTLAQPAISEDLANAARLCGVARSIRRTRRQRYDFFDRSLLNDPAWDILLTLFIADTEGHRMLLTSVIDATGLPMSTALRWIAKLTRDDLLTCRKSNLDRRSTYVTLSATGAKKMTAILSAAENNFAQKDIES